MVGVNAVLSEQTHVRGRVWRDGELVAEDVSVDDLDTLLSQPGTLVWLDISEPEPQILQQLAAELALDPQAVEDALAPAERPKATRHSTHTFVTVYSATIGDDREGPLRSRIDVERVSAFILPQALITVRIGDGFDMDAVVRRWDDNADLICHGVGALLHGLLDLVVDDHFETIQEMDDAMEQLEDSLFDDRVKPRDVQQRVYRLRKELVQLRRIILPMREVVNAVMRHHIAEDGTRGELDGWYTDLYDHVLRASEWTESLRDMISTIFETNLSLQDARLNTVMKKLAAWAAIIAVPTAVTGWFGQNVPYPGFQSSFGLAQSVALMVLGTVGLWWAFKRADWL